MMDYEVKRLTMDPRLRGLAARMATGPDPALVVQLWSEDEEPIAWFAGFVRRYWRKRCPEGAFPLDRDDAPARAVIAVYKEKREQLAV